MSPQQRQEAGRERPADVLDTAEYVHVGCLCDVLDTARLDALRGAPGIQFREGVIDRSGTARQAGVGKNRSLCAVFFFKRLPRLLLIRPQWKPLKEIYAMQSSLEIASLLEFPFLLPERL